MDPTFIPKSDENALLAPLTRVCSHTNEKAEEKASFAPLTRVSAHTAEEEQKRPEVSEAEVGDDEHEWPEVSAAEVEGEDEDGSGSDRNDNGGDNGGGVVYVSDEAVAAARDLARLGVRSESPSRIDRAMSAPLPYSPYASQPLLERSSIPLHEPLSTVHRSPSPPLPPRPKTPRLASAELPPQPPTPRLASATLPPRPQLHRAASYAPRPSSPHNTTPPQNTSIPQNTSPPQAPPIPQGIPPIPLLQGAAPPWRVWNDCNFAIAAQKRQRLLINAMLTRRLWAKRRRWCLFKLRNTPRNLRGWPWPHYWIIPKMGPTESGIEFRHNIWFKATMKHIADDALAVSNRCSAQIDHGHDGEELHDHIAWTERVRAVHVRDNLDYWANDDAEQDIDVDDDGDGDYDDDGDDDVDDDDVDDDEIVQSVEEVNAEEGHQDTNTDVNAEAQTEDAGARAWNEQDGDGDEMEYEEYLQ